MCNFFNECAEYYDKQLVEGQVYRFDSGLVKVSNKRYTSVKHDCEISFRKNEAKIQPLKDQKDIPTFSFNLVTIHSISEMFNQCTIDIACVVLEIDEKEQMGKGRPRKAMIVADETESSI